MMASGFLCQDQFVLYRMFYWSLNTVYAFLVYFIYRLGKERLRFTFFKPPDSVLETEPPIINFLNKKESYV